MTKHATAPNPVLNETILDIIGNQLKERDPPETHEAFSD